MLDIIKSKTKIGDQIKVYLSSKQVIVGEILEITDKYLILKKSDGKEAVFSGLLVEGYEALNSFCDVNDHVIEDMSTKGPEDSESKSTDNDSQAPTINNQDAETVVKNHNLVEVIKTGQEDLLVESGNEKIVETVEVTDHQKLPGVKIIGKIDLDKFKDKKRRFQKKESEIGKKYIKLIRAAKELNISMPEVAEIAGKLGISIMPESDHLISEDNYQKIVNYFNLKNKNTNAQVQNHKPKSEGLKLQSFQDLISLKNKIILDEGKRFLPPNGIIKRYGKSGFGFIADKNDRDYYFKFSSIVDRELRESVIRSNKEFDTQVVCQFHDYSGKLIATNIQRSKPIEVFFYEAEKLFQNEEYKESHDLLCMILNSFPDYSPAKELFDRLKYDLQRVKKLELNASNSYYRAKNEFSKGNIKDAKLFYEEAIHLTDHRAENAIKDLALIYQREGETEKAIELVKKFSKKFKSTDPNSFIAYFYESEKMYDAVIVHLEMVKSGSRNDNIKLTKRKAIAYYRNQKYDKAEELIKEVIKEQPDDRISQKILEGLDQLKLPGTNIEEVDIIFNEAELASFSGGLSPFSKHVLDNCEFDGVPPSEVREEKFSNQTLKQLRILIERMGKKRPKERAAYLLTEAKLINILDPDSEPERLTALTKYFTTYCDHACIENQPTDVVRFYILEASKAAKRMEALSYYIQIYLYSFFENSHLAIKRSNTPIDIALRDCLSREEESAWTGVTDLFMTNSDVFSNILSRLYSTPELRAHAVKYLNKIIDQNFESKISKRDFKDAWSTVVEKRKLAKQSLYGKYISLKDSVSSEHFVESFNSLRNEKLEHIGQTDRFKIKTLQDINGDVLDFNRQTAFEDKERYHNLIQSNIDQFRIETDGAPTEFSFNILREVVNKLSQLVRAEFARILELSSPELDIITAGEGILNQNKQVNFQILISNKKGSAPISRLEVSVENNQDIKFLDSDNVLDQTLKGGEEKPMKLNLYVSPALLEQKAIDLNVICKYKVRGRDEELIFSKPLALRFYSEEEFELIENPFSTTADSGPVEDPTMFFGREEFIRTVTESVLGSGSKCIIIYGQKRSGKSSVLFHLKNHLLKEYNAFCIQFSLGEIIEDLSSEVFYYKVLTEIEDTLDILRERNDLVPPFNAPTINEIYKAPSIIFNEKLRSLNRSFKSTSGWENKKLVLLLDEFTYIYTAIRKSILDEQFMKSWKSFLEKGYFTSVLVGQDIMPKFTAAYPNEFGVTDPKRLSYLKRDDAIRLIEKPIWDTTRNSSRFLGKAIDLILDYTSSNPYYIQIFCARLVEYMNRHKAITATETDIGRVAESFISGADALTADKFDNLITAGDAAVESFPPDKVLLILKEIAIATKNLPSCPRDAIRYEEKELVDEILNDLKSREVIDFPQAGYYKINVRLFKEWLLKN